MEFDIVHRAGKIKWKNSIWSDAPGSPAGKVEEGWRRRRRKRRRRYNGEGDSESGYPIHRLDSHANMKGRFTM